MNQDTDAESQIVDPEELRLLRELAEAAITHRIERQAATVNALFEHIDALRDHRAKASAPAPVLRCEPPEEFRHIPFHWVERPMCSIKPWAVFWSQVGGCWQMGVRDWTQEETTKFQWKYLGPCIYSPARPTERVEATGDAVQQAVDIYRQGSRDGESINSFVRRVAEPIAHFSVPAWSDEEIDALGDAWGVKPKMHCTNLRHFARALLAGKKP